MFTAKYRGYDIDLYRSTKQRWVGGVCGGLAENMQWSAGGLRLLMVILFMFTGAFAVFAYIAAIFLLASRPYEAEQKPEQAKPNLKEKVFSYGTSASSRLNEIRERLSRVDQRVRAMEEHVTSRKFQFEREMRRNG